MTDARPQKRQRLFHGVALKKAANKTVVVRVIRVRWHTKYHRQYRVSRTFKVHDEQNATNAGDAVTFVETRPLSKEKRWRLVSTPKT